jgi:hypothetical protein
MIDVSAERPITFNQAAKFLPDGRRPNFSTWWRWSQVGLHGVRLETVLCGGRRCTTAEAVARFFAAVTAAASGEPIRQRTTRQRQADIKRAEREVAGDGI